MSAEVFRIPLSIPMRDGIVLKADLYTQDDPDHVVPRPVVLQRTCYDRYWEAYRGPARHLARHGYATVVQDCRGRNDSEGVWIAGEQEAEDGYDTIEWLAAQPFADGRVGTHGGSYPGWLQMAAESLRPPSLKAMVVTSGYMQAMRVHGRAGKVLLPRSLVWVYKMSSRTMRPVDQVDWDQVLRTLPLVDAADSIPDADRMWRRWMTNESLYDPVEGDHPHDIQVPTLHLTGWEDEPGQSHVYRRAVATGSANQFLLIGPWDHAGTRNPQQTTMGYDHGPQSVVDMHEVYRTWFDRWLRDDAAPSAGEPTAAVFATGVNEWRSYQRWPAVTGSVTLHLDAAGDGHLGPEPPRSTGELSFLHDPADPVQVHPPLAQNRTGTPNSLSALDIRDDVLTFTTGVLSEPVALDGDAVLRFVGTATAKTADWCVWLADVAPDGTARRLTAALLRVDTDADRPDQREVVLGPLSHVFLPGHRIRLYLAGSNFPVWDRNLGIPGFDATTSDFVTSTHTVRTGAGHAATLTLQNSENAVPGAAFAEEFTHYDNPSGPMDGSNLT